MSNSGPTSSPHLVQASNFAFQQLFLVLVLSFLDMHFKAILKWYFDAMMCNVSLLLSSVCKCGVLKQHSADGLERTPEASSTRFCGWLWKFLACFTWMPCLGRHCKLKHVLAFVILKYFCVGIKRMVADLEETSLGDSLLCSKLRRVHIVKLYRSKSCTCQNWSAGLKSFQMNVLSSNPIVSVGYYASGPQQGD